MVSANPPPTGRDPTPPLSSTPHTTPSESNTKRIAQEQSNAATPLTAGRASISDSDSAKVKSASAEFFKHARSSSVKLQATHVHSLQIVQQMQMKEACLTFSRGLKEHASKLGEGALLVQIVGVKGSEDPLVLGQRSVNDPTTPIDENTIGRTGSGVKLWAGLLTNILTSKYGQFIRMSDGLGRFLPQEALRKFGRINPDGSNDRELAQKISVEGLIGMMAGLEYEQPDVREKPPETTLDQYLRYEVGDGSIYMLYDPQDRINFYTNNICFVAYPIEKAYKKVLAAKLIRDG